MDNRISREMGVRTHRLLQAALDGGILADYRPEQLFALYNELFGASWSDSRGMWASHRLQCVSGAATYLGRCLPSGFGFHEAEVALSPGIADVVWKRTGGDAWLIDEIKTGMAGPGDAKLARQVARLIDGGTRQWVDAFIGVRVVPLADVSASWIVRPSASLVEEYRRD
jgi:hypothetical protein